VRDVPDPPSVRLIGWLLVAAIAASFPLHSWTVLYVLFGLACANLAGALLPRARRRRRMNDSIDAEQRG
jgi:hypothetical protein